MATAEPTLTLSQQLELELQPPRPASPTSGLQMCELEEQKSSGEAGTPKAAATAAAPVQIQEATTAPAPMSELEASADYSRRRAEILAGQSSDDLFVTRFNP